MKLAHVWQKVHWFLANLEATSDIFQIPQSSKLTFGEDPNLGKTAKFPIINVKNVFVLPGIPELLEKSFDRLGKLFFQSSHCFYKKEIYFNQTETEIVSVLNAVVKKYPNVVFGSYPQLHHKYTKP